MFKQWSGTMKPQNLKLFYAAKIKIDFVATTMMTITTITTAIQNHDYMIGLQNYCCDSKHLFFMICNKIK